MTKHEFKQKCIELRLQNYTLGEIVKILKKPKTTIYFHIQKIPVSDVLKEKKSHLSRAIIQDARKRGLTPQKGKTTTGRKFKSFSKWTPEIVNLVGHLTFDGEILRAKCSYNNRAQVLISLVSDLMKFVYDYDPKVQVKTDGVIRISYYNIELANYLKVKSEELINIISNLSKECQRSFLKAFFDDEGCISFEKKRKRRKLRGFQYNDGILFLIQRLLLNFGIESKVDARFHEIIISRKKNLERFAREINFTPGLCVNGKRSNSIWKKDLEKREILQKALNSYNKNYSKLYTKYL